jgi:hypothetical protein
MCDSQQWQNCLAHRTEIAFMDQAQFIEQYEATLEQNRVPMMCGGPWRPIHCYTAHDVTKIASKNQRQAN